MAFDNATLSHLRRRIAALESNGGKNGAGAGHNVISFGLAAIDGHLPAGGLAKRDHIVTHLTAKRIVDMSDHLDALGTGEVPGSPQAPRISPSAPPGPGQSTAPPARQPHPHRLTGFSLDS